MIITYIHRIGWFIGLVLLQVLILNNVHIAGYATPFLYIYFILKFASGTSRNELMLWAFFFGLTIDIFADTPGMNAAATVLLAFLRPSLLRLFTPRDNLDSIIPSFKSMGITPFCPEISISIESMVRSEWLVLCLDQSIGAGFFSLIDHIDLLVRYIAEHEEIMA